jgi:hypothetical protein
MIKQKFTLLVLIVAALVGMSVANASSYHPKPVGTWLVTVEFPEGGPPPFKEFLVFNAGGTLTETNTTLHANSALNPASPLPLNGSMGSGAWKRIGKRTVKFTFIKFVFGVDGVHEGYLRVSGKARINGNNWTGEASTELLFGTDLDNPLNVIPFGTAPSSGKRIKP